MDLVKLKAQLKPEEGCQLFPYPDNGETSIGWGHCISKKGIPQFVADLLLDIDVHDALDELAAALPWVMVLDDVRQRAFADLAYNLGIGGLLAFHRMLAAAKVGDWDTAATELLDSKVARDQNPVRYQHLARMLRTGQDAP